MSLGTKNRQIETANLCKQHLREAFPDEQVLVEEFIVEIEGTGKHQDITKWGQYTDASRIKEAMFNRLDLAFKAWLNP